MASTHLQEPTTGQPLVNRALTWLLRSPGSRLVDRSLALLSVTGRRSGRTHTLPIQYAQDDDTLWIYVGDGNEKTWWRNLADPAPVQVLLRRTVRDGTGHAIRGREHPQQVEEGLRHYHSRYPRTQQRRNAPAEETILVRVRLSAQAPNLGRNAGVPHWHGGATGPST